MQSISDPPKGLHVGIIMDGNGRWAESRSLSRSAGHRAGGGTVRRVVEAAPELGIAVLTLFAFSSDNWRRPPSEVATLLAIFREFLGSELRRLLESGTRFSVIGRRDRLPHMLTRQIERVEDATAMGRRLHLRIAIDYSACEAIRRAAQDCANGLVDARGFGEALSGRGLDAVDLVIRSGGEKRLSDFLLWEAAYAELWFTDTMWPDFTVDDLGDAVAAFRRRERRFGGLSTHAAVASEVAG